MVLSVIANHVNWRHCWCFLTKTDHSQRLEMAHLIDFSLAYPDISLTVDWRILRDHIIIIIIIIIIIFYFPSQHKTNKDNNSWIQEYVGRLPEKQTLIKPATYLII